MQPSTVFVPTNPLTEMNASIQENNNRVLSAMGVRLPGMPGIDPAKQRAEIEKELMQDKMYQEYMAWYDRTNAYRNALVALKTFNPDSFSLIKAVFIVENAYFDNRASFKSFYDALYRRANVVKQIMAYEGLSLNNSLALNYAIQKLYQLNNQIHDKGTNKTYHVTSFRYDFDDIRGEKDYTKMFASKMLATGKGQCHSMPLVYLMITEILGGKAWLSLAPQHSFIKFQDANGSLMNFETTNGNLVSNNWLLQSGFINVNALKAGTYLDTLSQRKLYAQCLTDLLMGYMDKFGYDRLSEDMLICILQVDPNNMTALIIDANVKTSIAMRRIRDAGKPKEQDLPRFPDAYQAYLDMKAAYDKVDSKGYQDMPKDAYQAWLKTIDRERKKQQVKEQKPRTRMGKAKNQPK